MHTIQLVRVRVSLFSVLFFSFVSLIFATQSSNLINAGVSAMTTGDYATATADFSQAMSNASPGSHDLYAAQFYLIKTYLKMGDTTDMQAQYQNLLSSNPNSPALDSLDYLFGTYYYQQQNYSSVIQYLQDLIQNHPTSTYFESAQFYLIRTYAKLTDDTDLQTQYNSLLSHDSSSVYFKDIDYLLVVYYFETKSDPSSAQYYLTDLLQKYPTSIYGDKALFYQMRIASSLNNFSLMSTSFNQLLSTYPSSSVLHASYLAYGEGLRNINHDYYSANSIYQFILSNYPNSPSAPEAQFYISDLWMNGNLKDALGNMDRQRAINEAQKVIDQWPNTEWALFAQNYQCLLYQTIDRRDKARAIAQSIVSTYAYSQYSTQYIHALYSLSFMDYQDKNWDKATAEYRALILNYPNSYLAPEAEKQIARIDYFRGDISSAIQELQNLISNYSNTPVGMQAQSQLQYLQSKQTAQLAKANSKVLLSSTNNCGPVALRYVLAHYGVSAEIEKLAVSSGRTTEGTSFAGLARAAQANGFQAIGLKTRFGELAQLPLPMIVQLNHRQRDHFIAIYKMDKQHIYYADSGGDKQQLLNTDFQQQWTGYALVISPQKVKTNLRTLTQKSHNTSFLVLTLSQMETIMGGCTPPPPDDATDGCMNNWICPGCGQGVTSGGGNPTGGSGPISAAPLYSNAGQPSSNISGGAITSPGDGGGNSAVSLAVNGGNGWSYTIFPQISIPSIKGGHSLTVYRSYASSRWNNGNSNDYGNYGPDKLWGTLWTINYATHLDINLLQSNNAIIWVNEFGDQVIYTPQSYGSDTYVPNGGAGSDYAIYNNITISGSQFTLQFHDGTQYVFDSITQNYARLAQINFPNNTSVTCQYANSSTSQLNSITDPDSRQVTFGYTNGKLTSITDPWSRSVQYTYDSSSNLTQIQNPDGYTVYYYYNSISQITATRDSYSGSTNLYSYTYGGFGYDPSCETCCIEVDHHATPQCIAITDINGTQTQINYGGCDDALNGFRSGNWWGTADIAIIYSNITLKTASIYYDMGAHAIQSTANADGTNITYNYDGNGDLTWIQNQAGNTTNFLVDETNGFDTAIIDVAGNTTYQIYDNTYNVMTCSIDAMGKSTYYTYDTQRNLLSVTDALGNITKYAYDSYGNRTSATDALGEVSRFFYDSYSELTMVIKWDNSTTVFIYDTYGHRTAIIDPLGHQSFYSFDTMHRFLSSTDNLGGVTKYTYYVNGLLKSVTDAKGDTTNYTYDLRNRLTEETDAASNNTKYVYNCFDMVTARQDAKNQKTYYSYDAMNRVINRKYDTGTNISFSYDVLGNMTSINDPYYSGMVYYRYDILSRVTGYTNPWGSMVYAYDNDSRRTGMIDPNGNLYSYFLDALGRPALIENGFNQWTMYAYDSLSRKSLEIYPNGIFTAYTYTSCGCGSQILNTVCYQPTDNFNRSSLGSNWTVDTRWSISSGQLYVSATSDDLALYSTASGYLSNPTLECSMNMHSGGTYENGFFVFGYTDSTDYYYAGPNPYGNNYVIGCFSAGSPSNTTFSVPVYTGALYRYRVVVSGTTVSLYRLESNGWILIGSRTFGSSVPNGYVGLMGAYSNTAFDDFTLNNLTTVIAQYTYDYDKAGNRTDMFDMSTSTTYYYYDSLNRLSMESSVRVVNGYIRSYSYDSVGNRLTMINGTTTVNYNYNNLNQLTSSTSGGVGSSYSYDADGNSLGNSSTAYSWDYENEFLGSYVFSGSGHPSVSYTYDALGKRITRDYTDALGYNHGTQKYFYDGINVLMEQESGITQDVYTLAPGVIKEIISVRQTISGTTTDLFYHYDPIGNVLFVSDTSGNINTSYVQEGFGNVIAQSGSASNNYHLTTKEQDSNTGLYYFSARWYDPSVGRFVSGDPIWRTNLYYYVGNNPLRMVDPDGRGWKCEAACETICDGICHAIGGGLFCFPACALECYNICREKEKPCLRQKCTPGMISVCQNKCSDALYYPFCVQRCLYNTFNCDASNIYVGL